MEPPFVMRGEGLSSVNVAFHVRLGIFWPNFFDISGRNVFLICLLILLSIITIVVSTF